MEVAREEEATPGDLSSDAPEASGPSEGSPDPSGLGRPPADGAPLNVVMLRGCALGTSSQAGGFCPGGPGGLCPVAWVFFCRVLFCWVVFCRVFLSRFGRRFGAFGPDPMPVLKFCDVRERGFLSALKLCEPELSFRLVGSDDPKDGEI